MTWLRSLLLAGNAAVLCLLLAAFAASDARAQGHITGPGSIYGQCCRDTIEGGNFCCKNCCYLTKECTSGSGCAKKTEAEM